MPSDLRRRANAQVCKPGPGGVEADIKPNLSAEEHLCIPPGQRSRKQGRKSLVDFSPSGTCNIVDEQSAFIFVSGTIFTHSHNEDCAIHGLRIDTTFQVTGGPGPSRARPGAAGSSGP